MTLLQLLQRAEELKAGGFLAWDRLAELRQRIEKGEALLALTQTYMEAYESEVDDIQLDGSTLLLDRKVRTQRLLVMARSEARLYSEALGHLVEELEMECIRAEHRKAVQAREEARA